MVFDAKITLDVSLFLSRMEFGLVEFHESAMLGMGVFVQTWKQTTIPLVPIRDGELRGSAEPSVTMEGENIVGELRFHAMSKEGYDYAEIQNRRTDFNHPKGGQALYSDKGLELSQSELEGCVQMAFDSFR
jgi:hypothetical protein